MQSDNEQFDDAIERLTRDIKESAYTLTDREARFLVDRYYQFQEDRKRTANQELASQGDAEPHRALVYLTKQTTALEDKVRSFLDVYSGNNPLGQWARSIVGIGPVISAGLLAHIDLKQCPNAGHIWSFAGLESGRIWKGAEENGKILLELFGSKRPLTNVELAEACRKFWRRYDSIEARVERDSEGFVTWNSVCKALARKPWNSFLKTLCWKIGESFVKVSGNPKAFYGKRYVETRALDNIRNERGDFAHIAEKKLQTFNIGKTTEAYKAYSVGKLPPAHVYARSKRSVVKLFLSHYFEVGYFLLHGKEAPRPWAIEHGGHTNYIRAPNFPA